MRLMRGIVLMLWALALAACSRPEMLSTIDQLTPGAGADLVQSGVAFGTAGQKLDVWRPKGAVTDPRPVLIFYYGGGWAHGDRRAYAFAARAYANAGYVVVVPDYRKVPDVRFPAFLEDGAEAVKWTRDHIAEYGGDPGRIAVAGHSAGAYIAVMLTLDRRWLRAAGVDPAIIKAAVGLCGPYDFYPFTSESAIEAMAGAADPAMTQPINFARADAPPILLVTASKDKQVKPENAYNLASRLKALGAPVEFRNYAGLTHEDVAMALSQPFRSKASVLVDSVSFLNRTDR